VVPLLTSSAFMPSVRVLEWQLVGDVLKLSSWVMAFVVLARAGSAWLLLTELVAGVASLVANLWAIQVFALPGVGIAYVITYAAYWLIVSFVVHRRFGLALDPSNHAWLWLGLAAALTLAVINSSDVIFKFWLGGLLTVLFTTLSIRSLRAERHGRLLKI
jgi:O-antigen/teichoic acid export membrane protein